MQTPTCDLTDRPDPQCRCWRNEVCGYLCPRCAGDLQRQQLHAFVDNYGTREVRTERRRPALRVVR